MNEALELCKLCDERTLGLILALLRRTQGSSAASVITNLQASAEAGTSGEECLRSVRTSRQRHCSAWQTRTKRTRFTADQAAMRARP